MFSGIERVCLRIKRFASAVYADAANVQTDTKNKICVMR
jgi:hypothetical protein